MTTRDAYSMKEIAEMTGLGIDTIRAEVGSGHLRSKRIGRRIIIPNAWYQEWLLKEPEKKSPPPARTVVRQRPAKAPGAPFPTGQ
jgi:excisionase family DNA binding protein